jgi:hypothetical protein
MNRLFLLIIALLSTTLPMQADVLIYTGTIVRTEPIISYRSRLLRCFIVTDPATGDLGIIGYGKLNGVKRRDLGSITNSDYYTFDQAAGSVFDLYVRVLEDKGLGVTQQSLFLRGTQKTVTIDRINDFPITAQRARVLKGTQRILGIGLGEAYFENQIAVTLNATRTIDANVRNLTLSEALNELGASLSSLGYNL